MVEALAESGNDSVPVETEQLVYELLQLTEQPGVRTIRGSPWPAPQLNSGVRLLASGGSRERSSGRKACNESSTC